MLNKSTVKFENSVIEMGSLPQLEKTDFQGLEKDYLWFRITFISIVYLVIAGSSVVVGITSPLDWWLPLLIVTVIFGLIYLINWKGFNIKGYVLRQNDVSYRSGLLFFSITSVPFNRVQHTEVSQSPLARLFDLAEVKVYTAGGASSDLTIAGLKVEEAHRLKDHITKLSSKYA